MERERVEVVPWRWQSVQIVVQIVNSMCGAASATLVHPRSYKCILLNDPFLFFI